ncbi:MAG: hypothetical protein M1436_00975 [Acidobacteria bacterium]|nr:hypothetical protein [Acidobacteriota bacterium]
MFRWNVRKTRREFIRTAGFAAAIPLGTGFCISAESPELANEFNTPPDQARPWVYWFWKNGNIRKDGITADLEAMARAGIGGFIMMEVALTTPKGPVEFFSPAWRELFRHTLAEAERLGLQITVSGAPGWTGSGGPWVKPERSMQKITSSEVQVTGPRHFEETLPEPETVRGFYADVTVLAFPTPQRPARVADIREKALYHRGAYSSEPKVRPAFAPVAAYEPLSRDQVIPKERMVDLTGKMDPSGRLTWDVPEGNWTIARYGHTSTGQTNRPSPMEGLECDKLDKGALDEHFRQFTAKLVEDAGPLTGKTFVATHLDSWEMGAQNWSADFRKEFQKRRGYDPLPWLPAMKGWVIESNEMTERFLWDLRQTVSETIAENHGQHLRELAKAAGLWLSIEPYDMNPSADMALGAAADVPMCEFWSGLFDTRFSVEEATSLAHIYGRRLVASEAFTSGHQDLWKLHPALIKRYGDWAFSKGVNRFVIHRYVHQPFPQIRPGLSLAIHGLHCDRTETWWEISKPWHTYLARCQHLLRQGRFIADILYLSPEGAPNIFQPPRPAPAGYKFDACAPDALLKLASVRDGKIVFPAGAEYRVLVLPQWSTMTPELLGKVRQLADSGATVIGEPPVKAPGLSGYPNCDSEVTRLAGSLKPKLVSGPEYTPVAQDGKSGPAILEAKRIGPEKRFHRNFTVAATPATAELSLSADAPIDVRINGALLQPKRLDMILDRTMGREGYRQLLVFDLRRILKQGGNEIELLAEQPTELAGVLRMKGRGGQETLIYTDREWAAAEIGPLGIPPFLSPVQKDIYAPSGAVEALLRKTGLAPDFEADRPLRFAHRVTGDSDYYFVSNGERRTLNATCTFRVSGKAPELWHPETGRIRELPEYRVAGGRTIVPLRFEAEESYFVVFRKPAARAASGKNFPALTTVAEIGSAWDVEFDPKWGGPASAVRFEKLQDWTARPEEGIKYYSGTAIYRTAFTAPPAARGRMILELGAVREFAEVRLNGIDLGVQWKRPFRFDISSALKPGENKLEVRVTNLWPNRMIGDEHLPEDAEWKKGRLVRWPDWVLEGKSSPTGRYTFTHIRPYKKDSPLLVSGLLGPVRLRLER